MSISLQKGQKVSLSKESAGLSNVLVGLGWDAVEQRSGLFGLFKAADIDCDATAILLKNGKFVDKTDVVYFGNLVHKSGTVRHMGDNLTGEGEGDDEQILIELSRVPQEYDKIISREEYRELKQNFFKKIENAKVSMKGLEEKKKRMLSNEMRTQQWVTEFKQYRNIKHFLIT